jgi:hypothetical protein
VTEVEYSGAFEGPQRVYGLIGCELVQAVPPDDCLDSLYVDEEVLLRGPLPPLFATDLYPYDPLVGRALLMGAPDSDGNETPATLALEQTTPLTRECVAVLRGFNDDAAKASGFSNALCEIAPLPDDYR